MKLTRLDIRRPAACRCHARWPPRMKGLHYVLHAPQGDTYADLLFTMIERRGHRPPVTYTTFQARDLGKRYRRTSSRPRPAMPMPAIKPQAMIVGSSCTAELIQDDPGGLAEAHAICPVPVIALGLAKSYQPQGKLGAQTRPSNRSSATLARQEYRAQRPPASDAQTCSGATASWFSPPRRRIAEVVTRLLSADGHQDQRDRPHGRFSPADIARMGRGATSTCSCIPETGETAARWLGTYICEQPFTIQTVPIGHGRNTGFSCA